MNDEVRLHWKGYNPDGKLIFNSRKINNFNPSIFKLGHYEVSKCWDIALQKMTPGSTAEVYCPGELDLGGNVVNLYTHNDDNQWHH